MDGWMDSRRDRPAEGKSEKQIKTIWKKIVPWDKSSHWTNKSARIYYPSFFNMIMLFCSIYQGLSCSWTVIAPVGYHLQITYKKFEVHSGPRWEHYAACHFHKSYVTFVVVFFYLLSQKSIYNWLLPTTIGIGCLNKSAVFVKETDALWVKDAWQLGCRIGILA